MKRRAFLQSGILITMTNPIATLNSLFNAPDTPLMPALFIGHGSPMNAIEENQFSASWKALGKQLPLPKAIVCVSAHWETQGTRVTANPLPETIHDFGGFPQALFDARYPAPGDPQLAALIAQELHDEGVKTDLSWGLDHGTWSVLLPMYPKANIPVLQISLDVRKSPAQHFALAQKLQWLRTKGVMVIGSGNIVHNLGMLNWKNPNSAYDWATAFNTEIKTAITGRNIDLLTNYQKLGTAARNAVPTAEHYLPMLYIAAMAKESEKPIFFNEQPSMGSLYMTSFMLS